MVPAVHRRPRRPGTIGPGNRAGERHLGLRVFGAVGRLSFVGSTTHRGTASRPITQPWLKHLAQAWAADALVSMTAGPVRAVVAAVGLLSEHLSRRADAGLRPDALSHRDIHAFLARLAHLERAGVLSAAVRTRSLDHLARFLRDCREMGLTHPGAEAALLPDDIVIRTGERPRARRRDDEVGRALPQVVLDQLLNSENLHRLDELAGPTITAAVQLLAGVGRRTAELCSLAFDCLDFDVHIGDDGERRATPVLVHDMPKVGKDSLPITRSTTGKW